MGASQPVNKWLYSLAYLNDDAGRNLRRRHADLFMDLADRVYPGYLGMWQGSLDFIFMDPWLAKEYWPRFARLVWQKTATKPVQAEWEYLARMGDRATVNMFMEAWNVNISLSDFYGALNVLDELKPALQREVIDALVRRLRDSAKVPEDLSRTYRSLDDLVSQITSHDKQAQAEEIFAELQAGLGEPPSRTTNSLLSKLSAELQAGRGARNDALRKNVPLWLEHTEPDSPLVGMLAKAENPELRLMVMGALKALPSAQHQELLAQLLHDPDPAVRAAAEEAAEHLKELAAQQPGRYASDVVDE